MVACFFVAFIQSEKTHISMMYLFEPAGGRSVGFLYAFLGKEFNRFEIQGE